MFIPIDKEEFIKITIKENKNIDEKDLRCSLDDMIKKKSDSVTCDNCYNSIWAIGSAMAGWTGCFSCITGETDNSSDYEIAEVCFEDVESMYEDLSLENKIFQDIKSEYHNTINSNNDNDILF